MANEAAAAASSDALSALTIAPGEAGGVLPLPWQQAPLAAVLGQQRGHALVLHGSDGHGVLEFALALAQSWLCEAADGRTPACGQCAACRLVRARAHPDLLAVIPEKLQRELDWDYPGDDRDTDKATNPSRQLLVGQVRHAVDWVTRSTSRGRGKVVLLHPGEAMNASAANALLKTLEEPPAGTRLLITAADPARLLPTVRSRAAVLRVPLPAADEALAWLASQGVAEPAVLLAACAGAPLQARSLARAGIDAAAWRTLPQALAAGRPALAGWPVPSAVDTLLKLAHDAMAVAGGGAPKYFPAESLPPRLGAAQLPALAAWSRELTRVARHAAHPWNEGVLGEALASQAARALARPAATATRGR